MTYSIDYIQRIRIRAERGSFQTLSDTTSGLQTYQTSFCGRARWAADSAPPDSPGRREEREGGKSEGTKGKGEDKIEGEGTVGEEAMQEHKRFLLFPISVLSAY